MIWNHKSHKHINFAILSNQVDIETYPKPLIDTHFLISNLCFLCISVCTKNRYVHHFSANWDEPACDLYVQCPDTCRMELSYTRIRFYHWTNRNKRRMCGHKLSQERGHNKTGIFIVDTILFYFPLMVVIPILSPRRIYKFYAFKSTLINH